MFPRILAVSDLHANWLWYGWVARHAARFDLICFGGDLCDIFTTRLGLAEQRRLILRRLVALAGEGRLVAVAEGNHDAVQPGWLRPDRAMASVMWPGYSGEVKAGARSLLVTVCPDTAFDERGGAKREVVALMESGAELRDRMGLPWLVLHHEPTTQTPICWGAEGSTELAALVRRHQPDLVICGHIHEAPFAREFGGRWHHRIGKSLLVNAGQCRGKPWPCHLIIAGESVLWRAPGYPKESVQIG